MSRVSFGQLGNTLPASATNPAAVLNEKMKEHREKLLEERRLKLLGLLRQWNACTIELPDIDKQLAEMYCPAYVMSYDPGPPAMSVGSMIHASIAQGNPPNVTSVFKP